MRDSKFFAVVLVLALLFLAFVGGVGMMFYRAPGAEYFKDAFTALEYLRHKRGVYQPNEDELMFGALNVHKEDWRNPPVSLPKSGLVRAQKGLMEPGLTVYTPVYPWQPVSLIDKWGHTIHSWSLSKKLQFGPRLDGVEFPRDVNPAITDIHVYPNGDLLAVMGHDLGYQPYGYGLVKLNQKSEIIWTYMKQTHHQLDVAEDGRIAVLLNREIKESWPGLEKIRTPFMDEEVALLSAEGEELKVVSVLAAFQDTRWESVLQFVDPEAWDGDIFHLNAAKFLTAAQASAIPGAGEGDLLLSLRNLDVLAVLNVADDKIVWAVRGPWHMQHDPDVLDNGNILLFDNRGDLARDGKSRALEFNPVSMEVVWEWPGKRQFNLFSSVCGAVERLSNGNTLIAETNRGRMLEVTAEGEIVWEYVVPEETLTAAGHTAKKVWHPHRISREDLPFLAARKAVKEKAAAVDKP